MSATLYGGSLAGALSANASNPPRFAAKQALSNVNIGPLLKDAIDKSPVDGKGNVALDVSATGATVSQLKKGLNGTASLSLKDGAINGINLAAAIRNAKAKLDMGQTQPAPQQGTGSAQDKTDFTDLGASFKITNGVAHNDDLSAKTPLFRLGGSGDINIGESSLDYTARATVVPTLQGQGGPELQELKGLTVPVKLSGPFTAISWKVDLGGMASNRAKELIEDKKSQLKAESQKKIDEQKDKLQEQLKGQLKGLFGR
jgi:AsmA protein